MNMSNAIATLEEAREWIGRACTTQEAAMRASQVRINCGPAIAFLKQVAHEEWTQLKDINSDRRRPA